MSLVDGIFNGIGDEYTIRINPLYKVQSFNLFVDNIEDVSATRTMYKEFRLSRDNYFWEDWQELIDPNLQAIVTDKLQPYYVEVRYTRSGTDTTGTLHWTNFVLDVTLDLAFNPDFCSNVFTSPNLFCGISTDNSTFNELCGNLTEKIVKYGIIPMYINRTEDYIHYWKTICCFFSLHYVHAQLFAEIYDNETLLREFLRQRGMFFCGNEPLSELQDLANNFYREIRKRGTVNSSSEIKRILCIPESEEFIFAPIDKFHTGWVVDRASPLYKGMDLVPALNDMEETTYSVKSKDNYHLRNESQINIVADTDNAGDSLDVFHIDAVSATTGIQAQGLDTGFKMNVSPRLTEAMVVDDEVNYELSFFVKQEVLGSILTFGVTCFDADGNFIANPTENIVTGADEQYFFRQADVIKQTGLYVHVKGIIYNQDEPNKSVTDGYLNIGFGNNLRFKPNVRFVYPIILIENGASVPTNSTKIYGVRKSIVSNPYSLAFIESANMIVSYGNNNSATLSEVEIKERIDRYLIPINSTINSLQL